MDYRTFLMRDSREDWLSVGGESPEAREEI
jgi:hypothetical protein